MPFLLPTRLLSTRSLHNARQLQRSFSMVRAIKLNDGKQIPALAWGNGTGGIQRSGQKATELGAVALKAGILHIDTAQIYGTEEETGHSIKASGINRSDVWVTTKIGRADGSSPEDVRKSVQGSLDKLGFIPDLILIHNPFVPGPSKIGEFWTSLEALVEDGTLKGCSLGISNFRPQDIEAVMKVAKIKPVVNQIEYHPYVLSHIEPVLKAQEKYGIVTQSFGPLTPTLRHPTGGPIKPILTRIAKKLSASSGQPVDESSVLLLWTMNKGVVAVTTSGNPDNIKKLAGLANLPDLSSEEIKEIEEAGKKVHYRYYVSRST
ncbi:NADP-dependent oxidoreductase domain-containing protein [Naematelia encephala]|uniref:NADP-dependent oxidoreductase domain-containing protein n=1 Tax=Naematelia encephala TaxID=71784 RepID=A0A1Y2BCJ8_9TREE|nr:NADP-dependent oxidoreductase domain-containing protein [Naematelia encephala]